MGEQNFRGVYVPDIDEDIHKGITTLADGLGVVTRVTSIAAARTIVEANKAKITPASPAYFDIDGLIYVHDGTVFKPVNEAEISSQTYEYNRVASINSGQFTGLIGTDLGVKPYDRSFTAIGMARGTVRTGLPFLALRVDGEISSLAFFTENESQTITTIWAGTIEAGHQPAIWLGLYGGSHGGGVPTTSTVALADDARMNRLIVTTNPITMA